MFLFSWGTSGLCQKFFLLKKILGKRKNFLSIIQVGDQDAKTWTRFFKSLWCLSMRANTKWQFRSSDCVKPRGVSNYFFIFQYLNISRLCLSECDWVHPWSMGKLNLHSQLCPKVRTESIASDDANTAKQRASPEEQRRVLRVIK